MKYIKLLTLGFLITLTSQNAMASDVGVLKILKEGVDKVAKTVEGGVEAVDAMKKPFDKKTEESTSAEKDSSGSAKASLEEVITPEGNEVSKEVEN